MTGQVQKYLHKLLSAGLVDSSDDACLCSLDDAIYSNRAEIPDVLRQLFGRLNINSLIWARPANTVWQIIERLSCLNTTCIRPMDCESITFFHDLPVVAAWDAEKIAQALSRRKGCIVPGHGLITTGTVTLEQAFVTFSSMCFATFVKFFSDIIAGVQGVRACPQAACLDLLFSLLEDARPHGGKNPLSKTPPRNEDEIIASMDHAGKTMVDRRLVDSFFGNISCRQGTAVYISQTGSSLDELPGHIDRVALDGSSTCELTSSSELLAHVRIYENTPDTAILHGHPRFSVIMSLAGPPLAFDEKRYLGDIPVVAGEVGAGRRGLAHTLPPAMAEAQAAIVQGHGTFCSGQGSFHAAYGRLAAIEEQCYAEFRGIVNAKA